MVESTHDDDGRPRIALHHQLDGSCQSLIPQPVPQITDVSMFSKIIAKEGLAGLIARMKKKQAGG